jgi:hypothetical protein
MNTTEGSKTLRDKTPTIIATAALVVAVLGATPVGEAAGKLVLGKNSVGAVQLKKNAVTGKKIAKNAVTGAKVKDDSLSGADVLESSLGKVPSAAGADQATTAGHAATAGALSAPEAWHEVGSSGNPAFQNGWVNYSPSGNSAGYYKDRLGFVHLKGLVKNGAMSSTIFTLPPGYRSAKGLLLSTASAHVYGELLIRDDGRVDAEIGQNLLMSLDGIVFPGT